MKKTIITMALLAGAVSGYSQGTIATSAYGGSFGIQIFGPQASGNTYSVSYGGYSGTEKVGDIAGGGYGYFVQGTQTYAAGSALGNGYSVQLYAAPGANQLLSTLVPSSPVISTWYTAPGADPTTTLGGVYKVDINTALATVNGVAGGTTGPAATIALAAWDNHGGMYTTLAAAQAGGAAWGFSTVVNLSGLGGNGGGANGNSQTPPNLPNSITDFSLVTSAATPEPSTIALGVIGASTLLFRRRK